jgi:hypothetical protein
MHSGEGRYRRKLRQIRRSRQVADCSGLLHTAGVTVSRKQIRTADYTPEKRARLADAVAKARTAAGYQYRTDLVDAAKAAGEKLSIRSLQAVELGDPGVGQSVLFAIARLLPNWTEDTPRAILEGDEPPPTGRGIFGGVDVTGADDLERAAVFGDGADDWTPEEVERVRAMSAEEIVAEARMIGRFSGEDAQLRYLRKAATVKLEKPIAPPT